MARRIVFIMGFGRSGTTFLAKLLDSHPDVLYRHEPDSVLVNTEIPFVPDESDLKRYRVRARSYVESLCDVRAPKSAGHQPIFDKSYRTAFQQRSYKVAVYLAKGIEKGIPFLNRWAKVPDLIEPASRADIVYVIKSVNSVGRARLFREGNPQSRFLHIVRHPCGVIASVLRGAEKGYMQKRAYLNSAFRMKEAAQYPYTFDDMERRSF